MMRRFVMMLLVAIVVAVVLVVSVTVSTILRFQANTSLGITEKQHNHTNNTAALTIDTSPFSNNSSDSSSSSSLIGLGACLLIKDDNHWLVEWIAYHWFVLPLRHLVVYVDPNSATSPLPILERWTSRNLMTIHVWNTSIIPQVSEHEKLTITAERLAHLQVVNVQSRFLKDCMQYYKESKQQEWKWIALVDTDEFIAVNDWLRSSPSLMSKTILDRHIGTTPSNHEPGSVLRLIQQDEKNRVNYKHCIPMHRLQMCLNEQDENGTVPIVLELDHQDETNNEHVVSHTTWTHSDFLTHNFIHGERGRQVKNIVHVGGIEPSYFETLDLTKRGPGNIHHPMPGHCPNLKSSAWESGPYLARELSLLQVYHYSGTPAQRNFRTDLRGEFGHRVGTPPPHCDIQQQQQRVQSNNTITNNTHPTVLDSSANDDLMPWLQGFYNAVGRESAEILLEGVGRVDSWPAYRPS